MPIEITCASCGKRLRAPDTVAGKMFRCPSCQKTQQVPAPVAARPVAAPAPAAAATAVKVPTWHLKDESGQLFGPVTKLELDSWVAEGRVSGNSQVLRTGDAEWQWASAVYPILAAVPAGSPLVVQAGSPVAVNPFAVTAPTRTTQQSRKSDKSKMAAILFAFLLPGIGAHRFYLGYPGIGLLILFLPCVGAMWSIIEGFMLLTGSMDRDADGKLLQ